MAARQTWAIKTLNYTVALPEPVNDIAIKECEILRRIQFIGGNYIALVALLLGLFSSGWSVYRYFVGPDVKLIGPSEVAFECYKRSRKRVITNKEKATKKVIRFCRSDSRVTVIGQMTYLNKGDADYNGVVLREQAKIRFPSKEIVLNWQYFSNITTVGNTGESNAAPTLIPGRSSVSHETRFFPKLLVCGRGMKDCDSHYNWYLWGHFINEILSKEKINFIDFEFTGEVQERDVERRVWHCRVNFTEDTLSRLRKRIVKERVTLSKFQIDGEPLTFFVLPCTPLNKGG